VEREPRAVSAGLMQGSQSRASGKRASVRPGQCEPILPLAIGLSVEFGVVECHQAAILNWGIELFATDKMRSGNDFFAFVKGPGSRGAKVRDTGTPV
jgi:hypothetical protein